MKKRILAILLALVMLIGIIPMSVLSAAAETIESLPKSMHKIHEAIYYDKNPDPDAQGEMADYPAVWMSYDDPEDHTNTEVFVLKAVDNEEEAENKRLGMKGFKIDGKWYKVAALWTVYPERDIIDKGNGRKAVFTPLFYTDADKPNPGDKVNVALYDYDSGENGGISNLVEVVIPEKGKTTEVVVEDDKTIAPPEEVVLPYTGQPQNCPYTATAGYTVSFDDPETDAGIYQAILTLFGDYKWTDGTTEPKAVPWAIDKAAITSVKLTSSVLLYNGNEQYPTIASVNAGDLIVFPDSYTVSYSATPKLSGFYTLTVKGKGNFTGSASAEFHIDTVGMDTCTHDFPKEYKDNKDDNTHKVFCTKCGGCLANAEKHDLKDEPVNDPETGKPAGKYRTVCSKCGYAVDGDCDHSAPREYVDNGNGTHDERCSRCHVVFTAGEAHNLKETPVLSTVLGYEIYNGQVSIDCTKCSYHEDQLCSHVGTGRIDYVRATGDYPTFTHKSHCERCKMLLPDEEACTPGEWIPKGFVAHHAYCTKCGGDITGFHDFKGMRKITKFEATPYKGGLFNLFTRYNYRCWYTETCKVCQGVRTGWFDYPIIDVERWADYRAAFESIVKMSPEALQSFHDQDYLEGYKYYLLIPSWYLSPLYEATGTNEMNYANLQSGWLTYLTNTSEEGSCKMFDKNGKEIASHKPKDNKSVAGTGGTDGDEGEDEGISEDDIETWSFTEEDGAAVALSTDYLMSLPDGEYTYTACFSNESGEGAAVSVVFNIVSDEIGKKVTNVHPLGTMVNADGEVVSMNLSADTVDYTGESVTPPTAVLTSEMGVEYAEGDDYTLRYYQVVDGVDGEPIEVEVSKEDIKDIGYYNVVATPTRNGVLRGQAWASFVVAEPAPPLLGDVDGDGEVTVLDVTYLQRNLGSLEIPFVLNEKVADADGSGTVEIIDVTCLQRWLAMLKAPEGIGQPITLEPDTGSESALIGSWAYEEDENFVYTFNSNGTGTYTVYGEAINFTYTDNGTSVRMVFDDAPGTFDYTISGSTLTLKDSTGADVRYIKQ